MELTPASRRLSLFVASFLMLYFELALIRWIPGQVRIVAYFTNFILIACFFGMGLGMMAAGARFDAVRWVVPLVLVLVALAIACRQLAVVPSRYDDVLFLNYEVTRGPPVRIYLVLVAFYVAIAAALFPFGQAVGRGLGREAPLLDYAVNLLGSIAGIVVFSATSYFSLPAWTWFLIGVPLLPVLVRDPPGFRWLTIGLSVILVALIWRTDRGVIWSPYQKIDITPLRLDLNNRSAEAVFPHRARPHETVMPPEVGFYVRVNDDAYQFPLDLRDESVRKYPAFERFRAQYDLPFRLKPNAERVLIVGAGTGNDVAAALRNNAQHVDVVDIDPEILAIGRKSHPEHPYRDPRVTIHVEDARHFFQQARPGYDVVVFGLLDSHRLLGTLSSLRLDSYVYTTGSFRDVKRLLKPDGIQVTAFIALGPWMTPRFYEMLRQVYGQEPILLHDQGFASIGSVFVSGPGQNALAYTIHPRPPDPDVVLCTDDWPFLYTKGRTISQEYGLALALVVVLSTTILGSVGRLSRFPNARFFFLGAGFLLLETKNVTTIALVFGSTWYVNSIVFLSVLVMALLATLLMSATDAVSSRTAYAGLFASVALNMVLPLETLAGHGFAARLILVGGVTALPLFFSGIVFAESFKRTEDPAHALASNVLGGVCGGVLEYVSLIAGLHSLFYLILVCYALSILDPRRVSLLPASTVAHDHR